MSLSPGPTLDDIVPVDDYTAHSLQLEPDTHALSLPVAVENRSPENPPTSYNDLLSTLERPSIVDQGDHMDSKRVEEHCAWVEEQNSNKTSSYVPPIELEQRHQAALSLQTLSEVNHGHQDTSHMVSWTRPQTVQNYDPFSPATVPTKVYRFDSCEPSMTTRANPQYVAHHHGHPMPLYSSCEKSRPYLQCACCRTGTPGDKPDYVESNVLAAGPVTPLGNMTVAVMYIPVTYEHPAREPWSTPQHSLPHFRIQFQGVGMRE